MKIVSDFDGVWTDPHHEADVVLSVVRERLAEVAGLPPGGAEARIEAILREIARDPSRHGWEVPAGLAAFADEDPFIRNNAVCSAIAKAGDAASAAVLKAFGDAATFARLSYEEGVRRVAAEPGARLQPSAAEAIGRLARAGAEVVIVSNSSEDKVRRWLASGEIPTSAVRVRGGARKFDLGGDPPEAHPLAGRSVRVDRPHYRRILEEERPDAIVGDVVSLDLALPLALRRGDARFKGLHLLLMRRPTTPAWSLEALGRDPRDAVVDGLPGLVAWVEAAARA